MSGSDFPLVSIVIPTLNNEGIIERLLRSIYNQDYPNFEVIIVDSSTDRTPEIVKNYPCQLIKETRFGINIARNTGVKYSKGSIIVFTDADSTADSHWLSELVRDFTSPDIGCVGGSIFASNANHFLAKYQDEAWLPFKPKYSRVTLIDASNFHKYRYPVGSNFALRKEVFDKVGGFEPSYVYAADDWEILWKLCKAGYKIVCTPKAVIYNAYKTSFIRVFQLYIRLGFGAGVFCRENTNAPISRKRMIQLILGIVFACLIAISSLLSLFYSRSFLTLTILALLLPVLPFAWHSTRLAIKKKNFHALIYPFADYILAVAYVTGLLCGIFSKNFPRLKGLIQDRKPDAYINL